MLSLSSIDLAVYSTLAIIGLSNIWLPYLRGVQIPWPAFAPTAPPTVIPAAVIPAADWKAETVENLIRLQAAMDEKQMAAASKLCRELIWLVLGGDAK